MSGVKIWMRMSLLAVSAVMLGQTPAIAQTRTDTAAIYLYRGADRDQRLLDAARKEGTLTFYTSMQTPESGPLSQAFEKKYGIKIQLCARRQRTGRAARGGGSARRSPRHGFGGNECPRD